jgi:hypothetical protein
MSDFQINFEVADLPLSALWAPLPLKKGRGKKRKTTNEIALAFSFFLSSPLFFMGERCRVKRGGEGGFSLTFPAEVCNEN